MEWLLVPAAWVVLGVIIVVTLDKMAMKKGHKGWIPIIVVVPNGGWIGVGMGAIWPYYAYRYYIEVVCGRQ